MHGIQSKEYSARYTVQGIQCNAYSSRYTVQGIQFKVYIALLDCCVPQGSIVGPQQFSAYIEDMSETIEKHINGHHFYADDTQLQESTSIAELLSCLRTFERCVLSIRRSSLFSAPRPVLNVSIKPMLTCGSTPL